MYMSFWGGVAFYIRVTLLFGTPYLMLWSFFPLVTYRAFSHKETVLGFSVEQRALPLCRGIYYELFTHSETLKK